MGETRSAYIILAETPERKKPLGRPKRRWKVNIKMYLKGIRWEDMDWIPLAQEW
jgi:hypothetical protein